MQSTTNTQRVFSALLTGSLFELPAGDLAFAFGVDSRKETYSYRDDGLAVQGMLNLLPRQPALDADFSVNEAYLEVLAPLLADKPFAHALNVEAAVRYSDYDTIGSTTAWKVGGDWAPIEDLRFRATVSSSVRAPNLNELFTPQAKFDFFFIDPCQPVLRAADANRDANCSALGIPSDTPLAQSDSRGIVTTGGNPILTEETSDSYTIGAVFTPRFLEGLQISVDYWNIEISDAIQNLGIAVVDRCVDASSINNPFCAQITRNADFTIATVDVVDINVSDLTARGVDFQINYGFDALGGNWNVGLFGTKLLEHESLIDPTDPLSLVSNLDLMTHPDLRMSLVTSFSTDRWTYSMTNRYISERTLDNVNPNFFPRKDQIIPSEIYTDLKVNFAMSDRYNFYLGVNNVTEVEPKASWQLGGGGGVVDGGALADNVGRYFHGGMTIAF